MTNKRWRPANMLKPEDMPAFQEAAVAATTMPHKAWVIWLNHTKQYKYAFICKMAKHVGLCTPGHAFYPKMQKAGRELQTWNEIPEFPKESTRVDDDDLLWSQE